MLTKILLVLGVLSAAGALAQAPEVTLTRLDCGPVALRR